MFSYNRMVLKDSYSWAIAAPHSLESWYVVLNAINVPWCTPCIIIILTRFYSNDIFTVMPTEYRDICSSRCCSCSDRSAYGTYNPYS